jgi:hypothetical protein
MNNNLAVKIIEIFYLLISSGNKLSQNSGTKPLVLMIKRGGIALLR